MDSALRALAEPRRREIIRLVWTRERSANEIASRFNDISRPAISQHLRVLKEAQLLSERRDGTRRLYRSNPEELAKVRDLLGTFWDTRLEHLRLLAENEERERTDHDH